MILEDLKLAVVCGGISTERQVSLNSGRNVYECLQSNGVQTVLIEIDDQGLWHLDGNYLNLLNTSDRVSDLTAMGIDLVFNALHGQFGEDGQLQALLDSINIKYTGSGIMSSSIGINKDFTYKLLDKYAIRVPKTVSLSGAQGDLQDWQSVSSRLSLPVIVKPNDGGSSIGVTLVNDWLELQPALQLAFESSQTVLVQEFIKGREITCPVIGIGNSSQALIVGEISTQNHFFDYQAKYDSEATQEIFPANLPQSIVTQAESWALQTHRILECRGLTRSDFIYRESDQQLFFLEINTSPGMTQASLCPKSAAAAGWSMYGLIQRICEASA